MKTDSLKIGDAFEEIYGPRDPDGEYQFSYTLGTDNCYDITVGAILGRFGPVHVYIVGFYNPLETHVVLADRVTLSVKRKFN